MKIKKRKTNSTFALMILYIKKFAKRCLQLVIIGCITLLLFEIAYRYGVIDFYKAEIEALNPSDSIENHTIDYLVFGDSFSTPTDNYVDRLREKYPKKSFLNLSIPGTGIKQVNTFAKKKIKRYSPKHIIYQVYIGNDLLDVRHVSHWKNTSFVRNVYWKMTDHIWSGVYMNQKLKGLRSRKGNVQTFKNDIFSKTLYTKRQSLLFNTDASYLYKTITLQDDFLKRYHIWKKEMRSFLEVIPDDVEVSIVFVPHGAQVDDWYYSHMLELGAQFEDKNKAQENEYKFYSKAATDFKAFDNVSFYNPLAFLKQKDTDKNRLYYSNDPHFNDQGQIALYEFLDTAIFDK